MQEFRDTITSLTGTTIPECTTITTMIDDIMLRQECLPNTGLKDGINYINSDVICARRNAPSTVSISKYIDDCVHMFNNGLANKGTALSIAFSSDNSLVISNIQPCASAAITLYIASSDRSHKATICININATTVTSINSIVDGITNDEIIDSFTFEFDYSSLPNSAPKYAYSSHNFDTDLMMGWFFNMPRSIQLMTLTHNMLLMVPWYDIYSFGSSMPSLCKMPFVLILDENQSASLVYTNKLKDTTIANLLGNGSVRPFTILTRNGNMLLYGGDFHWIDVHSEPGKIKILDTIPWTNRCFENLKSIMQGLIIDKFNNQILTSPDCNAHTADVFAASSFGYQLYDGIGMIIKDHVYIFTRRPDSKIIVFEVNIHNNYGFATLLDPINNNYIDFFVCYDTNETCFARELAVNGVFHSEDEIQSDLMYYRIDEWVSRNGLNKEWNTMICMTGILSYKNLFVFSISGNAASTSEYRIYRYDGNRIFTRIYSTIDKWNGPDAAARQSCQNCPHVRLSNLNYTYSEEGDASITHVVWLVVGINITRIHSLDFSDVFDTSTSANIVYADGIKSMILAIHDQDTDTFTNLGTAPFDVNYTKDMSLIISCFRINDDTIIYAPCATYFGELSNRISIYKRSDSNGWLLTKNINMNLYFIKPLYNNKYLVCDKAQLRIYEFKDDMILIKTISVNDFASSRYMTIVNTLSKAIALECNPSFGVETRNLMLLPQSTLKIKLRQYNSLFNDIISSTCDIVKYNAYEFNR